jgi:hypothetical protein
LYSVSEPLCTYRYISKQRNKRPKEQRNAESIKEERKTETVKENNNSGEESIEERNEDGKKGRNKERKTK